MGKDADRVQVLFVTVDPQRDTPALLAQYVPAFNPSFLGLYTDPESLAKLAAEFKVVYQRVAGSSPQDYLIDHTAGHLCLRSPRQTAPVGPLWQSTRGHCPGPSQLTGRALNQLCVRHCQLPNPRASPVQRDARNIPNISARPNAHVGLFYTKSASNVPDIITSLFFL